MCVVKKYLSLCIRCFQKSLDIRMDIPLQLSDYLYIYLYTIYCLICQSLPCEWNVQDTPVVNLGKCYSIFSTYNLYNL